MKNGLYILGLVFMSMACEQDPWSEKEQNAFMKECRAETNKEDYCRCYMANVMDEYPQAEDSKKMSFEEAVEFSKECE